MSGSMQSRWSAGHGVIGHREDTVARIGTLLDRLVAQGILPDREQGYALLAAADRLASQALWLVAHMTYASRVRLDGSNLEAEDFKSHPDGHTGGSLNMAIAYTGYLLANALTRETRAWIMEQGHCVAAISAVNTLVRNTSPALASRYTLDDEGLSRLCSDFYSMEVTAAGYPRSPQGSHTNAHTAGGIMEGGYLGFAGLQYVHMPLPGQRLVAFLSDGAFEEQRGTDWASRWWRADDSGLVMPIMIANGRRIDQRTTVSQSGGTAWFEQHLRLNSFEPIVIDGRDPAAFAWAILTQEHLLEDSAQKIATGEIHYPVRIPYVIAETIKGFGFPGAGTNSAHNLPLGNNPRDDEAARAVFNQAAKTLWVEPQMLNASLSILNNHDQNNRPRERDHALAQLCVDTPHFPAMPWQPVDATPRSAMEAIDAAFSSIVRANPALRVRVGNPDEIRSNRMNATLELLKHRVTAPEAGIAEAVNGCVITALNEEAVACAAFGNKQGLNLIVSYEAFAVKMLGCARQEIIFSRHCKENGYEPRWLSVPLIASSHVWENGKNEQSHQDPSLAEALLSEMSDVSRVLFPVDWNSAIAALASVYRTRGAIVTIVAPKNPLPALLESAQANKLVHEGIALISGNADAPVQLMAIGAYQLQQALLAAARMLDRNHAVSVWAILEPGRFREPRDAGEKDYCQAHKVSIAQASYRVFFCHARPEGMLGTLRPLDLGVGRTRALGYNNRGGTLDAFGMLFANRCTWAHGLHALAEMQQRSPQDYLSANEIDAVNGIGNPLHLLH